MGASLQGEGGVKGGGSDGGVLASHPGVNSAPESISTVRVKGTKELALLEKNAEGGGESVGTPVVGPAAEALRVRQTLERVGSVAFGVAKDIPSAVGSEIDALMRTIGVNASGVPNEGGAGGDDGNTDVRDADVSEVEIDGSVSSSDDTSVTAPADNSEARGECLL